MQARRRLRSGRWAIVLTVIVVAALVAFALSKLNLSHVGHALITASPGWIALALALMACSLLLRSLSWFETLRAALPETPIRWPPPCWPRSKKQPPPECARFCKEACD